MFNYRIQGSTLQRGEFRSEYWIGLGIKNYKTTALTDKRDTVLLRKLSLALILHQ